MAGTRSSANNTPEKAGTKRKATASSPEGKSKGRPAKGQKTLEETVAPSNDEDLIDADVEDEDMKEVEANTTATKEDEAPLKECAKDNTLDQVKADENEEGTTSKPEESKNDTNGNAEGTAVEEDKEREKAQPSNIMEKGIIYFFTRGRVGVEVCRARRATLNPRAEPTSEPLVACAGSRGSTLWPWLMFVAGS